jgi:hypothetical protein
VAGAGEENRAGRGAGCEGWSHGASNGVTVTVPVYQDIMKCSVILPIDELGDSLEKFIPILVLVILSM